MLCYAMLCYAMLCYAMLCYLRRLGGEILTPVSPTVFPGDPCARWGIPTKCLTRCLDGELRIDSDDKSNSCYKP